VAWKSMATRDCGRTSDASQSESRELEHKTRVRAKRGGRSWNKVSRSNVCVCVCDDDDDKLGKWRLNNGCGRRRALLVLSPDQGVSL